MPGARFAARNTDALSVRRGRPRSSFLEPSCLSAVREDAPALLRGETRRRRVVAKASVLFEEFARTIVPRLTLSSGPASVLLHGHCHQKSMGLVPAAKSLLSMIPGSCRRSRLRLLRDGRLVGVFARTFRGVAHHRRTAAVSAVRDRQPGAVVAAAGTSCRHQIRDFTGVEAVHPAVLLRSLVDPKSIPARGR